MLDKQQIRHKDYKIRLKGEEFQKLYAKIKAVLIFLDVQV